MTEISSDLDSEGSNKNQLLYDVMKSKISKDVHSVKSHHMAVGELCINMLVGISKNDVETPNHHMMRLKKVPGLRKNIMGGPR